MAGMKFYQFDYAEVNGIDVKNMGILNIETRDEISKELLRDCARKHLKKPDANIVISNISRLTKDEYQVLNTSR